MSEKTWADYNPELWTEEVYNRRNIDELMVYISKFIRSEGHDLDLNERIVGFHVLPSKDGTVLNIRAVIEQETPFGKHQELA